MELSKVVALTALFFILVLLLAPEVLGAERARERAVLRDEAAELKRLEAEEAARAARRTRPRAPRRSDT